MLAAVEWDAHVDGHAAFDSARGALTASPYDLLITNLRLEEYNGLHLVYLARLAGAPTRAVVYDAEADPGLAGTVRRAGAFFELAERVQVVLSAYVDAALPDADRRGGVLADRRGRPRGGRRLWDQHMLAAAGTM